MTDRELFDTIFNGICRYKDKHYADMGVYFKECKGKTEQEQEELRKKVHPYEFPFEAYVELARDIHLSNGKVFKAGTKMRVVLASNMGDLCLTSNLNSDCGYELRVCPGHGDLTNCVFVDKDGSWRDTHESVLLGHGIH